MKRYACASPGVSTKTLKRYAPPQKPANMFAHGVVSPWVSPELNDPFRPQSAAVSFAFLGLVV